MSTLATHQRQYERNGLEKQISNIVMNLFIILITE